MKMTTVRPVARPDGLTNCLTEGAVVRPKFAAKISNLLIDKHKLRVRRAALDGGDHVHYRIRLS
jgi:hypothetical protein